MYIDPIIYVPSLLTRLCWISVYLKSPVFKCDSTGKYSILPDLEWVGRKGPHFHWIHDIMTGKVTLYIYVNMWIHIYIYTYVYIYISLPLVNWCSYMFLGTLSVPMEFLSLCHQVFLLGAARMSLEVQAHFLEGRASWNPMGKWWFYGKIIGKP